MNLVDCIWTDRPSPPMGPVHLHPMELSGESSASKRARVSEQLLRSGLQGLLVTAPDNLPQGCSTSEGLTSK